MSKYKFGYEDERSEQGIRCCDFEGCNAEGEFRAPKTRMLDRGSPNDYHWFCLAHIREFNKKWNFFEGMSDDEILNYKDEDITGHRPTWKLGSRTSTPNSDPRYDDPFDFQKDGEFGEFGKAKRKARQSNDNQEMDAEQRAALATLNLQPGCTINEIKKRRNELAKKYHPDIRGGDKQAEEILKSINQAYTHLLSCGNL